MGTIDDNEIKTVVGAFEDVSIGRDKWKHAQHMIVGLFYVEMYGYEEACQRMREGILNLLVAGFKVDLIKEMPYHETITVFWLRTIDRFSRMRDGRTLQEKVNEMLEIFDKDYPLRFYSRERLFSDEARRTYLAPDIPALHEVDPVT